ncbi:MAG: hypothetical protein NC930_00235 [Candidatus Omnitrophica bacterium]|nr:hypothetical protein [Candidatus Omnitrophota bacterium]
MISTKTSRKLLSFHWKLTAILVLICFSFSQTFVYAASGTVSIFLPAKDRVGAAMHEGLVIPSEFGMVEESYAPPGAGPRGKSAPKTVIYIQDAHDSLEAQEHIAQIIKILVAHHGVKTVFEEGYEGPVPTDAYFGFIKDPALKEKVSYFLMDKLRLGGAEYAHINREMLSIEHRAGRMQSKGERQPHLPRLTGGQIPPILHADFQLIGADSIRLHLENINWYRQAAKRKPEIDKDLCAIDREIQKLAHRYFQKSLKTWMNLRSRFENEKIGLVDYLKRLRALLPRSLSSSDISEIASVDSFPRNDIPGGTSKNTVIAKRPPADDAISNTNSNLSNSIFDSLTSDFPVIQAVLGLETAQDPKVLDEVRNFGAKRLFEEIEAFENSIAARLLDKSRDREIFRYYKGIRLLQRLNRLEMTPEEFEALRDTLESMNTEALAEFVARETKQSLVLSKLWEEDIRNAVRFYELAQARDRVLGKILRQSQGKVTVLVFGGFHKENIKQILREEGFSYHILIPKVTSFSKRHQDYYKQLMAVGYHKEELPEVVRKAAVQLRVFREVPQKKFPYYLRHFLGHDAPDLAKAVNGYIKKAKVPIRTGTGLSEGSDKPVSQLNPYPLRNLARSTIPHPGSVKQTRTVRSEARLEKFVKTLKGSKVEKLIQQLFGLLTFKPLAIFLGSEVRGETRSRGEGLKIESSAEPVKNNRPPMMSRSLFEKGDSFVYDDQIVFGGNRRKRLILNKIDSGLNLGNIRFNLGEIGFNVGEIGFNVGEIGFNLGEIGFNVGEIGFNVGEIGFNVGDIRFKLGNIRFENGHIYFKPIQSTMYLLKFCAYFVKLLVDILKPFAKDPKLTAKVFEYYRELVVAGMLGGMMRILFHGRCNLSEIGDRVNSFFVKLFMWSMYIYEGTKGSSVRETLALSSSPKGPFSHSVRAEARSDRPEYQFETSFKFGWRAKGILDFHIGGKMYELDGPRDILWTSPDGPPVTVEAAFLAYLTPLIGFIPFVAGYLNAVEKDILLKAVYRDDKIIIRLSSPASDLPHETLEFVLNLAGGIVEEMPELFRRLNKHDAVLRALIALAFLPVITDRTHPRESKKTLAFFGRSDLQNKLRFLSRRRWSDARSETRDDRPGLVFPLGEKDLAAVRDALKTGNLKPAQKLGFVIGTIEIARLFDRVGFEQLLLPQTAAGYLDAMIFRKDGADPTESDQLRRALSELVSNVIEHVADRIPVGVPDEVARKRFVVLGRRVDQEGRKGVEVIVADQGEGIPARALGGSGYSTTGDPHRGKGLAMIINMAIEDNRGFFEAQTKQGKIVFTEDHPEGIDSRTQFEFGTLARVVRYLPEEIFDTGSEARSESREPDQGYEAFYQLFRKVRETDDIKDLVEKEHQLVKHPLMILRDIPIQWNETDQIFDTDLLGNSVLIRHDVAADNIIVPRTDAGQNLPTLWKYKGLVTVKVRDLSQKGIGEFHEEKRVLLETLNHSSLRVKYAKDRELTRLEPHHFYRLVKGLEIQKVVLKERALIDYIVRREKEDQGQTRSETREGEAIQRILSESAGGPETPPAEVRQSNTAEFLTPSSREPSPVLGLFDRIYNVFKFEPFTLSQYLSVYRQKSEPMVRQHMVQLKKLGMLEYLSPDKPGGERFLSLPPFRESQLEDIRFVLSEYVQESDEPFAAVQLEKIRRGSRIFKRPERLLNFRETTRGHLRTKARSKQANLFLVYELLSRHFPRVAVRSSLLFQWIDGLSFRGFENQVEHLERLGLVEHVGFGWIQRAKIPPRTSNAIRRALRDYARDLDRTALESKIRLIRDGEEFLDLSKTLSRWDVMRLFPEDPLRLRMGKIKLTLPKLIAAIDKTARERNGRPRLVHVMKKLRLKQHQRITDFARRHSISLRQLGIWGLNLPSDKETLEKVIDTALLRLRSGDKVYRGMPLLVSDLADELRAMTPLAFFEKCRHIGIDLVAKGVFLAEDRSAKRKRYTAAYLRSVGIRPWTKLIGYWMERPVSEIGVRQREAFDASVRIRTHWEDTTVIRRAKERFEYVQNLIHGAATDLRDAERSENLIRLNWSLYHLKRISPTHRYLSRYALKRFRSKEEKQKARIADAVRYLKRAIRSRNLRLVMKFEASLRNLEPSHPVLKQARRYRQKHRLARERVYKRRIAEEKKSKVERRQTLTGKLNEIEERFELERVELLAPLQLRIARVTYLLQVVDDLRERAKLRTELKELETKYRANQEEVNRQKEEAMRTVLASSSQRIPSENTGLPETFRRSEVRSMQPRSEVRNFKTQRGKQTLAEGKTDKHARSETRIEIPIARKVHKKFVLFKIGVRHYRMGNRSFERMKGYRFEEVKLQEDMDGTWLGRNDPVDREYRMFLFQLFLYVESALQMVPYRRGENPILRIAVDYETAGVRIRDQVQETFVRYSDGSIQGRVVGVFNFEDMEQLNIDNPFARMYIFGMLTEDLLAFLPDVLDPLSREQALECYFGQRDSVRMAFLARPRSEAREEKVKEVRKEREEEREGKRKTDRGRKSLMSVRTQLPRMVEPLERDAGDARRDDRVFPVGFPSYHFPLFSSLASHRSETRDDAAWAVNRFLEETVKQIERSEGILHEAVTTYAAYDDENHGISPYLGIYFASLFPTLERGMELINAGPDDHLLELGAGSARVSIFASGRCGAQATAYELDPRFYRISRRTIDAVLQAENPPVGLHRDKIQAIDLRHGDFLDILKDQEAMKKFTLIYYFGVGSRHESKIDEYLQNTMRRDAIVFVVDIYSKTPRRVNFPHLREVSQEFSGDPTIRFFIHPEADLETIKRLRFGHFDAARSEARAINAGKRRKVEGGRESDNLIEGTLTAFKTEVEVAGSKAADVEKGAHIMRQVIETGDSPAILYLDGQMLAGRAELRTEAFAVAFETQILRQFRFVIYNAQALLVEVYEPFASLRNVLFMRGDFSAAYKQYGRNRRVKKVRVVGSEGVASFGDVDNFLWENQTDIWAALIHAIADDAVFGIHKVRGVWRVVSDFLRRQISEFRGTLVVKMSA